MRFTRYEDARAAAEEMMRKHKLDVAIRKTVEFGKTGFNVSFASRNDSDYARAEIVSAVK